MRSGELGRRLTNDENLHKPPNPKVRLSNPKEPVSSPRFAANFSVPFANWAMETYGDDADYVVDPFCGSGTSLLAAGFHGLPSLGIELNPAWVIYGRARLVPISMSLEGEVESMILKSIERGGRTLSNSILKGIFEEAINDNRGGRSASEDVFAACVLTSSRDSFHPQYGMNHSWPMYDRDSEVKVRASAVRRCLRQFISHARWVSRNYNPASDAKLILGDARNTNKLAKGATLFLTSPPYLSRLDYVRASSPELDFFRQIGVLKDVNQIREEQIGTVAVGGLPTADRDILPQSSRRVLRKISSHPGKASKSYYAKFFANYLTSMDRVFESITDASARSAILVMVVQDSWYKDLHIPTSSLLRDMLTSRHWTIMRDWRYDVKAVLSSLNPYSREWMPSKTVSEFVQAYARCDNAS